MWNDLHPEAKSIYSELDLYIYIYIYFKTVLQSTYLSRLETDDF